MTNTPLLTPPNEDNTLSKFKQKLCTPIRLILLLMVDKCMTAKERIFWQNEYESRVDKASRFEKLEANADTILDSASALKSEHKEALKVSNELALEISELQSENESLKDIVCDIVRLHKMGETDALNRYIIELYGFAEMHKNYLK